jgi:membrane dipeptidase
LIVVDAHCDTLLLAFQRNCLYDLGNKSQLDLKRLINNVNLQLFAVFIESCFKPYQSLQRGLELIETYHKEIEKNSTYIQQIKTKKCLLEVGKKDKIFSLLTVEGGEILQGNLLILDILFRLGVRSICLTWNQRNEIADGCGDSFSKGGLTYFGLKIVEKMNYLGMIIDLAHISEKGFWSVLEHSRDPIMVSHANCQVLQPHVRNLNNEQIIALSQNGGVMGITFVPEFLSSDKNASIDDVIKHIDYAVSLAGPNHVGLGSDFDGSDGIVKGLEDVTKIYNIAKGLAKRGYSEAHIDKIMGGNFIRLFNQVLPE